MTKREKAQEVRKIAKRVFRRLARKGRRVRRKEWTEETKKEASCTGGEAYNAVDHLIKRDNKNVGSEPIKEGGKLRVYFYRQSSSSTTSAGTKTRGPGNRRSPPPAPAVDTKERASGKERPLYGPVAEWIKGVEKGCKADILGDAGKRAGRNWWTPDVVAVLRPAEDIQDLHFSPEVISVEIKADAEPQSVITGFGQACAYKVFSHKSYFVAPEAAHKQEERLLPLCDIFGIGLILFEGTPDEPNFVSHSRARSHQPSMHHVAEFLKGLPPEVQRQLGLRPRIG